MKILFTLLLFALAGTALAQVPPDARSAYYDTVIEVTGTDYMLIKIDSPSKKYGSNERLLFINTKTGESHWGNFPDHFFSMQVETVSTGRLQAIVICARIFGLTCNHPKLFVLSSDGRRRTEITDDAFTVEGWKVNHRSGSVVVTGFYDDNGDCLRGSRD
jgi:hypothetical protein